MRLKGLETLKNPSTQDTTYGPIKSSQSFVIVTSDFPSYVHPSQPVSSGHCSAGQWMLITRVVRIPKELILLESGRKDLLQWHKLYIGLTTK